MLQRAQQLPGGKGSLKMLRIKVVASVNVISVLLTPAGQLLALTVAAGAAAGPDTSKSTDQQQQRHEASEFAVPASKPSLAVAAAAAVGECHHLQTTFAAAASLPPVFTAALLAAAVPAEALDLAAPAAAVPFLERDVLLVDTFTVFDGTPYSKYWQQQECVIIRRQLSCYNGSYSSSNNSIQTCSCAIGSRCSNSSAYSSA